MKFTYPNADLSRVIKRFTYEGNHFHVEYFDGTISDYYCDDPDKTSEIRCEMMIQALERDEQMWDRNDDKTARAMFLYFQMLLAFSLQNSISNDYKFMTILSSTVLGIISLLQVSDVKNQIELKKYRMFFDMYEDLDEVNKAEFMDAIRIAGSTLKRLDIETLDSFSYGQIKILHRKLEQEKN